MFDALRFDEEDAGGGDVIGPVLQHGVNLRWPPTIDWVGPGDKPTNSLSLEEGDAREALHWAYFNALPTFPLRKTETPLGLRAGYPDRLADRAAGALQFAALVRPVSASGGTLRGGGPFTISGWSTPPPCSGPRITGIEPKP